jgi:hypothetical protein
MTQAAIEIDNLCKTYAGGKRALDGVSFDVPRGQIFGLLGPNGAGKSTLINILAGLVNKTEGRATIWGFDVDAHPRNAKASIGIVNQEITVRSLLHAARDAGDPGRALRRAQEAARSDGAAPRGASRGQGQGLFAHALGRHEAAADGRQGDGPFAAGAGPRRADRGRRRRASPAALGLCPRAQRARRHGGAHHALSRGSRAALRPDRDHQPRQADRQQADPRAGRHGAGESGRSHRRSATCRCCPYRRNANAASRRSS